jgi:hypothetical protein
MNSHRLGKPVLNLEYLFETIVQKTKPMDWPVFWHKQVTGKQTLKVSLVDFCQRPHFIFALSGGGEWLVVGESSGTLGGEQELPDRRRAVAVHESFHAAAGHHWRGRSSQGEV